MPKIINIVALLSLALSLGVQAVKYSMSETSAAEEATENWKRQWEAPLEDVYGDSSTPVDDTRFCGTFWYPRSCYKYCDNKGAWCWVDTSKTCYQNSDCDQTADCAGTCA